MFFTKKESLFEFLDFISGVAEAVVLLGYEVVSLDN
jgi:hypothetical protein